MLRLLALTVLASLLLSGCTGGGASDPAPAGSAATTGTAAAGSGNLTAPVTAPTWTPGQAWTWTVTSGALQEGEAQVKTIVLAGSQLELGVEDALQGTFTFPFHLVPMGPIDAACLCWTAHGLPVQLLRFPLKDGDAFTADFWAVPGAQVSIAAVDVSTPFGVEAGYQSTVSYPAGGVFLQADYAPGLGQFVRVASYFGGSEPFAESRLTSAGTASGGVAYRATELARYTASAGDPASQAPRPLTVPADADLLLLACFLPGGAPGAYFVELAAPGASGLPVACGGMSFAQTALAAVATPTQAGPAAVTAHSVGQGNINVEVFAIDTTVA